MAEAETRPNMRLAVIARTHSGIVPGCQCPLVNAADVAASRVSNARDGSSQERRGTVTAVCD